MIFSVTLMYPRNVREYTMSSITKDIFIAT